jgi:hypothetical protein
MMTGGIHTRYRWLLSWALGLGVAIGLAVAGAAFAYWIVTVVSGTNFAEAGAQTLPTGATPVAGVVPVSNQNVTITFAQTSTSGGAPLTAYSISRYAFGSGSSTAINGSCSIAAAVVTCTDAPGVGSWQYTDVPTIALSSWAGQESAKSPAGVVLALTTTTIAAPSSAVVNTGVTPSATLSGATTVPAPGGTISFAVFGPQATAPGSCTGVGWNAVGAPVPVTANGTYAASASYTPTVAGTYWWYSAYSGDLLNAASNSGCGGKWTVVHLALSPSTLPAATVYAPYSQAITASGGTSAYTFALTTGTLPTGLVLSSGGVLSGTINAAAQSGTFSFTVTATDSAAHTGTASYSLVVNAPTITLLPATLPNPTGEVAYSQTLTASGGQSAYTFSVTSGSLPTGLSLATGGLISGTGNAPGTFAFTVTATDVHGYTGARAYSVTVVSPTITLSPATLPAGVATVAYNQALTSSGGVSPYSDVVTSGSLPSGLSLSTTGVFTGAPATAGTYNFTVTATDVHGFSGARAYALVVAPKPALGETLLGGNGASPCVDQQPCQVNASATTSGATELILVYFTDDHNGTIDSISGPFTGATRILDVPFSNHAYGVLSAWRASGNGAGGTVSVNYSGDHGTVTVVVDVIQLSGNSTSSVVAQTTTNTGWSSPATSTFSLLPLPTDAEIVLVATTANSTLPAAGVIDSNHGSDYGYGFYFFPAATSTQSFAMGTSGPWGTIGIEINHG